MKSPRVRSFPDAGTFLDQEGPRLLRHLGENNLLVGIATTARDHPEVYPHAWFGVVERAGESILGALRTPPRNVVLGHGPPEAIPVLVEALRRLQPDLPGVVGPRTLAEAFSRHWGGHWREAMAIRGYHLERVNSDPHRPAGRLVRARDTDEPQLTEWIRRFREDAHLRDPRPAAETARYMLDTGAAWYFEVEGRPVCALAGACDLPHGARVGMVYTPRSLRGRGYGSAAIARFSQHLLDRGARACFLFTDLDNPVSNAIYQRVGYAPICDFSDRERLEG